MKKKIYINIILVTVLLVAYSGMVIWGFISKFEMYDWLAFLYCTLLAVFIVLYKFKNFYQGAFSGILLLSNIALSLSCSIQYTSYLKEYRFEMNNYWLESFLRYGLIAVLSSSLVMLCTRIPNKNISLALQVIVYLFAITFMVISLQHFLLIEY